VRFADAVPGMADPQLLDGRNDGVEPVEAPTAVAIICINFRLCAEISPLNKGRSAGSSWNRRS
jgi:hypothetical protein